MTSGGLLRAEWRFLAAERTLTRNESAGSQAFGACDACAQLEKCGSLKAAGCVEFWKLPCMCARRLIRPVLSALTNSYLLPEE